MKLLFWIVICLSVALSACKNESSTPTDGVNAEADTNTEGDATEDTATESSVLPAFSGFDFTLSEGDFWEYKWDDTQKVSDRDGTATNIERGLFRLTLGPSILISGIDAFEIIVSGNSIIDHSSESILTELKYLAVSENKIFGSKDGVTLDVIFDGSTFDGLSSGGLFTKFNSSLFLVAQQDNISNDYLDEPAILVSDSFSEASCEFFSGVGNICTGTFDAASQNNEYYQPNIGPVGSYHRSTFSTSGFLNFFSTVSERNVGLFASSLKGDLINYDLETEPNDSLQSAQKIISSLPMFGNLNADDEGTDEPQIPTDRFNTNQTITDWYTFTIPTDMTSVDLQLDFSNSPNLGVYLFDSEGVLITSEAGPNITVRGGVVFFVDSLNEANLNGVNLSAGIYYIGLHAYTTNSTADYTLTLSTTP